MAYELQADLNLPCPNSAESKKGRIDMYRDGKRAAPRPSHDIGVVLNG